MTEPTPRHRGDDIDLERPENDVAEQQQDATDDERDDRDWDDRDWDDRSGAPSSPETSIEVDPADAAEQDQVADVDEDEYRG